MIVIILHTSKELDWGIFVKNSMYLSWILRKLLHQSNSKEVLKKQKKNAFRRSAKTPQIPEWSSFFNIKSYFHAAVEKYSSYSIFKIFNIQEPQCKLEYIFIHFFLEYIFIHFYTFLHTTDSQKYEKHQKNLFLVQRYCHFHHLSSRKVPEDQTIKSSIIFSQISF